MIPKREDALFRQQRVLAEFGELALRSEDINEILEQACRLVGEALGTELAKVMELQEDGHTLLVRAGVGWRPGVVGEVTVHTDPDSSEGYVLKTGSPAMSPDIESEKRFKYPEFIKSAGVRALVNVVIIGVEGKPPYGLLQVDSRALREFTQAETDFLRSYANLLAAAVNRLQMLKATQENTAALHNSERQLRILMEGIPQIVWRAVGQGHWTWAGPQWTAYTGLSEASSRGRGWLEALHPSDRAGALVAWSKAEENKLYEFDYRLKHGQSGDYHWFQTRGTPAQTDLAEIEWLGTSTDIDDQIRAREMLTRGRRELEALVAERTSELEQALKNLHHEVGEREHAEEQLRQSEKLKAVGQLTGGIAHDLNNMLQTISGSLSMIRARLRQSRFNEVDGFVDRAETGTKRAAALTHRLLAFARRQTLCPKPVDLDQVARDMEDIIRRTVAPAVEVELKLADGRWLVMCDPNQMESALLNLCVNARDAMPDGGWLTVSTQELIFAEPELVNDQDAVPGRYVAIAVSDTGTGMSPEVAAHVFEPFFTTKPLGQGTGLGLSQIYGFVRQSGGLVQIETAVGSGTTVRLCLPIYEPQEMSAEFLADGKTLLLVEDEEDVRDLTAEQLRDLGCRVLEAESGAAALRLVQTGTHIDLLISDVGLPGGMNGRQVVDAVRQPQ